MKILKILLMFLCVLGAIVGIIVFLGSGGTSSAYNGSNDPAFQAAKADIERSWSATEDWSDDLYEQSVENLRQQENDLSTGYQTLLDMTNEYALVRLDALMMSEFSKADCNATRISTLKRGLDKVLRTSPSLSADNRVKKMLGTYSLYSQILQFGKSSHACGTGYRFNGGNATWTDFSAHAQNVKRTRDSFKSNMYFSNIRNITAVTSALNDVERKLQTARNSFAANLAKDIKNSFMGRDHEEMQSMLQATYARYANSYSNSDLYAFVSNY